MSAGTIVTMSPEMQDALEAFAHKQNKSRTQVMREAIALYIDYDLVLEQSKRKELRGRPRLYNTEEERKQAARERSKRHRELQNALIAEYKTGQRREEIQAIVASIERKNQLLEKRSKTREPVSEPED